MKFFDGRNVLLEEFPGLLEMEGHTGFFGIVFGVLWFFFAAYNFPDIRELRLVWWFAGGIGVAFLILYQTSFMLVRRYFKQISSAQPTETNDIETRVREWIAFLTGCYVIVSCVLIWLTGGISSPFTLFYVMVFTLTIGKCKYPAPAIWVFFYFFTAIVIASYIHLYLPSPIPEAVMTKIIDSDFNRNMHFIFLCASLIVPLLSAVHVHLKEKERLKNSQRPQ